jgi:LacI family transcriptional regulator
MPSKIKNTRPGKTKPRKKSVIEGPREIATLKDVAEDSGFSPITVSRVINGVQYVRRETRDAINTSIAKLKYSPNLAARSLAAGKQLRIGLLFNDASNTFSSELLASTLEHARLSHVQIEVGKCNVGRHEIEVIEELLTHGVDGMIVPPPLCDSEQIHQFLASRGILTVAVGSTRSQPSLLTVRIDDYAAAASMTEHLVALGHRRIGFIIGDLTQGCSAQRLAGYKSALHKAGIKVSADLIQQGEFTFRSGLKATDLLLQLKNRPSAIFASNDNMAAATVAMAHRYHLDVPKDLTVCGFDDTEMSRSIWPELTTIRQPIDDMSRVALQMLVGAIQARRESRSISVRHRVLDFSLVRRESDGAPLPVTHARRV